MNIMRFLIKNFLVWLLVLAVVTIILFMPREITYLSNPAGQFLGMEYQYSIETHLQNIKNFFSGVIAAGSLGEYNYAFTNEELILSSLLKSAKIAIPAIILGFAAGLAKGLLDFRLSGTRWRVLGKPLSYFPMAIPDFAIIVGIQLGLMFLYEIGMFPHIKLYGSENTDTVLLCILFLSIYPAAFFANVTLTCLEDEQHKDYIRTARSKGTPWSRTIMIHLLKNIWHKILPHFTGMSLYIFSNLFIVEKLTEYKGAGFHFFNSVFPGSSFVVGQEHSLNNPAAAFGFLFVFTTLILIIRLAVNLILSFGYPEERS